MNTYLPDNRTVKVSAPASTVIEPGDLMYWDSGNAVTKPASSQTDAGSEVLNQRTFALNFLGVSQDQRLSGQSSAGDIVVIQEGVFQFACPATDWAFGDLVGASENGAGNALLDQQVEKVTNPALAIGVCLEDTASGATKVKCYLKGRVAWDPTDKSSEAFLTQQGRGVRTATLAGTDTLTVDSKPIQVLDPGGAGRDVVLPNEAASAGFMFIIHNSADAAEILTIKASNGTTTVCTPTQNESAIVYCDGTTWRGIVGANN